MTLRQLRFAGTTDDLTFGNVRGVVTLCSMSGTAIVATVVYWAGRFSIPSMSIVIALRMCSGNFFQTFTTRRRSVSASDTARQSESQKCSPCAASRGH